MPTLVLMADTHGFHHDLEVPAGDFLIHAGDMTAYGSLEQVAHFADFLTPLPHRHKIVIAGNHDWCFEQAPRQAQALLDGVTYLHDQAVTLDGLRVYGSPWQPWFMSWAFNLQRGTEIAEKWAQIPDRTDILITHGPPAGILDETSGREQAGCHDLLCRVGEIRPMLHVFGHIHEARGILEQNGTIFVNAATYGAGQQPLVVTLP